jgi:hypothetical protein
LRRALLAGFAGFAALTVAAAPVRLAAQSAHAPLPPLPATGVDWTGIDLFWMLVDTLSHDIQPSEAQWQAIFATPGYRLVGHPTELRQFFSAAYLPSRRAERDSILAQKTEDAARMRHLVAVVDMRPELARYRDSLARTDFVAAARQRAAILLPPGATAAYPPPLTTFSISQLDGYSHPDGVIIDLKWMHDIGRGIDPLAHEFHHSYLAHLTKTDRPPPTEADAALVDALRQLPIEGMADLIDKPYPLSYAAASLQWMTPQYNDAYARTPATLRTADSVLAAVADDPSSIRKNGASLHRLFPFESHANGAYMARTILETFGRDSLMPSVYDQFAFFRTYAAAEKARGNPPPFSAKAIGVLNAEERKYLKP